MAALFDTIHDNALSKRAEPATLEEFVEFGLQPEDYTHYVGLQMRVQGEFMAYGCTLADTRHPAITELISFCHEKDLIKYDDCCNEAYFCSEMISCSFDADYRHDWLRYPRNPDEFRLAVERRLSRNWMQNRLIFSTHSGPSSLSMMSAMNHRIASFGSSQIAPSASNDMTRLPSAK